MILNVLQIRFALCKPCRVYFLFMIRIFYFQFVARVTLKLFPRYGSVLGGTAVQVFGPCFDAYAERDIMCSFDGVEVPGLYINKDSVICVSPAMTRLGRVDFALHISGTTMQFAKTTFYSCKNIYTYIYMYVFMYVVFMCVCTYMRMYVCMYVRMYVCSVVCICIIVYVSIYCVYVYMYECVCICDVRMYVC